MGKTRPARDQSGALASQPTPSLRLFLATFRWISFFFFSFWSFFLVVLLSKRMNPRFLCNQEFEISLWKRHFLSPFFFLFHFIPFLFMAASNYTVQFRAINVWRNVCALLRALCVCCCLTWLRSFITKPLVWLLNGVSFSLFSSSSFSFFFTFTRWLILVRDKRINGLRGPRWSCRPPSFLIRL